MEAGWTVSPAAAPIFPKTVSWPISRCTGILILSNNLVPDTANTRWVWNSQLAKVNSKGQELETFNALNIYTAAQYGYDRGMPVAITNNARSNEAAYEGFEDNNYIDGIDKDTTNNCTIKHIDFSNLSHSRVLNTDTMSFNSPYREICIAV